MSNQDQLVVLFYFAEAVEVSNRSGKSFVFSQCSWEEQTIGDWLAIFTFKSVIGPAALAGCKEAVLPTSHSRLHPIHSAGSYTGCHALF